MLTDILVHSAEQAQSTLLGAAILRQIQARSVEIHRTRALDQLEMEPHRVLPISITLCPLYAQGALEDSQLLMPGSSLDDSRVAIKWQVGIGTLVGISRAAEELGFQPQVSFTLADAGVIKDKPTVDDETALKYHEQIYRETAEVHLGELGIPWTWQRYSDVLPDFPRFVPTHGELDDLGLSANEMSERLFRMLCEVVEFHPSVINGETGVINRNGKRIVNSMINLLGPTLTYGLLKTYGAFDPRTSYPHGLNLFFERGELLLNVANLFPHRNYPGVDILAR